MGNVSSLTAYMDSLGPPKAFTPEPYLCAEADTLTMYFQNTPSRAERVNNFLTVFKAFDSDELVGFELKGILKKMEELGSMISVFTAKTRKVHIKLILMAYLAEAKDDREPYDGLIEKSSKFDDAMVQVPA